MFSFRNLGRSKIKISILQSNLDVLFDGFLDDFRVQLEVSSSHRQTRGNNKARDAHGDIQKLSFNSNSFDYILSFEVLEHVPHAERATEGWIDAFALVVGFS